jgi:hypothetical protein
MDAINTSAKVSPKLPATQLTIGGAGYPRGSWINYILTAAERWAA